MSIKPNLLNSFKFEEYGMDIGQPIDYLKVKY